ncbi:contractile injection system tape measure protein [Massilia antarctica]|uniref:contractile injection system tape measure protein n=1 Tax=Massilia antarctica TaxID=2765360 RepID=UPI0022708974|nr:contractile injection system tape measure protein [Massilia sp. H27-R4]MCY0914351.1 contractile injection system tape measure protein [Massilia sp. H27-R4]
MSAVHRIGELLVELTFESDAPRPQPVPHERLLELVKGRMLPELETVLDEMDDGRLRRIERLDIDLGDVPAHLLDAELGERLRELLRGALGDALRANPGVAAGAGTLAHDAARFERFLRSGAIDGRGDTPAALLERLLANDALALPGIVRRAAAVAGAVKRLAQQIDGEQLRRLLPLLAQEAGAWLALVDAIGAALAGDAGARRQQARTLWELVLAHVLDAPCGEVTPALRAAAGALGADASAQTRALLLAIGIDSASRAPGPDDAQARFAQALSAADVASIRADWDELVAHHAPALRAVMLRRGADQALWQRVATHFPLSMLDDMATLAGSAATGRKRDAWAGAMFEALAPAAAADARIKQFVRMLAEANPDYLPSAWTELRRVHADALAGAMRGIGARHDVWQRVARRFPLALLDELTMLLAPQALSIPEQRVAAHTPAQARNAWLAGMMHLSAVPFDAARYRAALRAPGALVVKLWQRIEACLATEEDDQLPEILRQEIAAHAAGSVSPADFLRAAWDDLRQGTTLDPAAVEARAATAFVLRALLGADASALSDMAGEPARAAIAHIGANAPVWTLVAQRFPVALLDKMTMLMAPQAPAILHRLGSAALAERDCWFASMMHLAAVPFDAARYTAAMTDAIGAAAQARIVAALLAADAASLPPDAFSAYGGAARIAIASIGARSDVWERVTQRFPPDVLHRMTALLAPQASELLRELPDCGPERWLASFMHLTAMPFDAASYAAALGLTWGADAGQRIFSALLAGDAANLPADIFSTHSDAARAVIARIGARGDVWERVAQRFPLDVLARMTALLAPQSRPPVQDRKRWLASFMHLASGAGMEQGIYSALLAGDAASLPADIFGTHNDATLAAIARIGARGDVWERVAQRFPPDVLHRMTALLAPQAADALREQPIRDPERWLASFMHLTDAPFDAARYATAMGVTGRADIGQRILSALLSAGAANLPADVFSEHSDAARAAITAIGARADVWERVARQFPLDVLGRMTALLAPQGEPPIHDRDRWLARFMQLAAKPSGPAAMGATSRADIAQRIFSALLAADAANLPEDIFGEHSDVARETIARIGARADVWEKVAQRFPLDVLDRMTALLAPQGAPPTQDRNRWLARFMQLAAKPSGPAAMDVTSRAAIVQRIRSALLAADAAKLPAEIFDEHSDAAREAIARIGPRADVWERVAQRFRTDVLGRMMALLAPQGEPPIQDRNRWLARLMQLAAKPSGPAAMGVTSRADIGQQIWSALLAADAANLPEDIFGEHSDATREAIARIGARGDVWERVARRFPLDVLERMTALLAPQAELPIRDRDHWLASFMPLAAMPFDAHRHVAALVPGAPARQNQRTPAIPVLRERIDSAADPERLILSALMSSDADAFEAALRDVQDDGARKAIAHIGARFDVWQGVAQRFPLALLGRITALLAPRAAIILRDLHAGAHAAAIPERQRWLASIMHLTTTPFDAARYAAAMSALAIDTGSEADTESAQRILSALLAADAAALLPDTLVVHADAARQAIARIGARADVWQPVARRFPLALLDEMTALMAPAAPAILRQPPIASGGAALPARERWLASIMHLAAIPFDPVRYAAAVGAPVPPDARSGDTAQPLQRILAALGDADAAALTPDLLSTHDDAARQAIARTGARFDVWQRVALRFPLALLDELTTLVAPQAPAILRGIAAASGAPARDLWLASIMHLAVTPFDAQRYSAALRAPSAHMIDLWRQVAARTAAVENQLERDMQMQAIAAHAAHSASPPDFLRAAHDALGHGQRIDLAAVDARARTAFLLRALVDGDAAGLTPAVFAGLGDHARKAIMDIGARAAVWEPVAQDFPAQVLDALSAMLEPQAARTPAPDRARWLAAIMRLTAAPAPAAQAATPAAHGDTTGRLRQAIKAHMASPDSVLQHAIDAHAERSADTAGFLRVVLTALEAGAEIDLEAIAGQVDSQPAAAEPPPASAAPSPPEDPMPAAPTIHAQSDPDVLRRIAAHLDNAGEHGKTLLGAAQAHASRSAAPQAYLGHVLDDLANERAVDLDDLDQRFAAPPPAPKRAAVSCARALAAHAPAQRAALAHLLHGAGDDSAQFSAGLLDSVVTLLAGADLEAVQRCAREVGGALARDLPAPAAARIGLRTRQFAFGWFFEQRLRFEPAAYARALASHLTEPAGVAAPAQRHASALRPAQTPATASLLDDECDALYLSNAGQVLAGPYLPRLFAMVGLTEGARFKNAEAAERAVHLVQFIVSGQTDCPEYQLGLNKVLCGLKLSAPIVREIVPTGEELEAVDTMLRAMIAHWKTIGNTSPDGLRQAFLQRPGSMHLKDDAWRLKVEAGSFDMLLDALPWSFSVIRHPWMERAVHVEWR